MPQQFGNAHGLYNCFHVVGSGATPLRCSQLLNEAGIPCIFWETAGNAPSFAQPRAQVLHIPYQIYHESVFLNAVLPGTQRTLIFSVNNPCLFPARLLEADRVTVLNYHNSLLPRHRGVHAEAWSIFENDVETGITWHKVDAGIDTGNILAQKTLRLDSTMTSIALLRAQSKLALCTLIDILPSVLEGHVLGEPQAANSSHLHLRREIPNNGELSPAWNTEKAWGFLRAMDYGVLRTLGAPFVRCEGLSYSWRAYEHLGIPSDHSGIVQVGKDICFHGSLMLRDVFVCKSS